MESLGVILSTTNHEAMAQFLTEIIECDIEANEKQIYFELFNQKFVLESAGETDYSFGLALRFSCTADEIDDLAQKFEFFKYRYPNSAIELQRENDQLTLVDADKRRWIFSSRNLIQ